MRQKQTILTALVAALTLSTGPETQSRQRSSITVGENVRITTEQSSSGHSESWIGIDPLDDRRLIACSMVYADHLRNYSTSVFVSSDGGMHWTPTLTTNEFGQSGDPFCTFGPDGTAYFAAIVIVSPQSRPETYVYRSTDAGRTWLLPVRLPLVDREYLAFDDTNGLFRGQAYLHGVNLQRSLENESVATYSISLFRSSDGFRSFDGLFSRDAAPPSAVVGVGNSVVLSDGTLVILSGQMKDISRRYASRSERVRSPTAWLRVIRSTDGGRMMEPATTIGDWYMAPAETVGANMSHLAADRSGGIFNDRLYATWADLRTGRLAIYLAHSSDRGKTWSSPIAVDDARTHADPADGPDAINPAVAVNNRGVVAVTWADRRDHADNLGWNSRIAASFDGGDTFLPSVRLSFSPNSYGSAERWALRALATGDSGGIAKNDRLNVNVKLDNFFYSEGDTTGLAADRAGAFHPTWVDNRTGTPQLWTAAVSIEGEVVKHGDRTLSDLDDLTNAIKLEVVGKSYDRATDNVVLSARLRNTGKQGIVLPVTIRAISIDSEVGEPSAVGSENGMRGPGAVWTFSGSDALSPGEATAPKAITFHLANVRSFKEAGRFPQTFLNLDVRVLGRLER